MGVALIFVEQHSQRSGAKIFLYLTDSGRARLFVNKKQQVRNAINFIVGKIEIVEVDCNAARHFTRNLVSNVHEE